MMILKSIVRPGDSYDESIVLLKCTRCLKNRSRVASHLRTI